MSATLDVDAANAGRRLDVFLRQSVPQASLGTIMKWIRTGAVRLNGKRSKPAARLAAGDVVRIPSSPDSSVSAKPRSKALAPQRPHRALPSPLVVHEDEALLIVDKPPGLACHAGTKHTHDTLAERIIDYLGCRDAAPGHRPGLAQRLDRDVSGLVPVGKDAPALRALAEAVTRGEVEKTYLALVDGRVAEPRGTISLALRVDDEPRGDRPRTHPDPGGLPAVTHFEVIERLPRCTLLALTLETGRTHQIRAHVRALGHPLLGDPRYGPTGRNTTLRQAKVLERPFLHATTLRLRHPTTGAWLTFTSPLPNDLQGALDALRSEPPVGRI